MPCPKPITQRFGKLVQVVADLEHRRYKKALRGLNEVAHGQNCLLRTYHRDNTERGNYDNYLIMFTPLTQLIMCNCVYINTIVHDYLIAMIEFQMKQLQSDKSGPFCKELSSGSLNDFSWEKSNDWVDQTAQLTMTCMRAMFPQPEEINQQHMVTDEHTRYMKHNLRSLPACSFILFS